MARTTAPLFSLDAKGTLGDILTYQKKGKGTAVIMRPVPTGDPSAAQYSIRQWMGACVHIWRTYPGSFRSSWNQWIAFYRR